MTSEEREGRPEPADGRGGAEKPSVDSPEGELSVRRRRVVLHQGLPDPIEPEGGAR